MSRSSPTGLVVLIGLLGLPWIVQPNAPGDLTFVMSWGLVNTNPWHVLSLPAYFEVTQGFSTLPWSLQVWPFGLGFYCGALVSAAGGVFVGREDIRLTIGFLVLSAVGSLTLWWGLLGRGASGAIPVGALGIAVVIWWLYWPKLGDRGS